MSETTKDGGPAFPIPDAEPGFASSHWGMSLRDYFAAKAMQGILSNSDHVAAFSEPSDTSMISGYAYAVADGMLQERQAKAIAEETSHE